MMEKCCLLISANESYQMAEKDLEIFTGVKVSHSTLQRLVKRQEFELPTSLTRSPRNYIGWRQSQATQRNKRRGVLLERL
jgi:hypothetical protein